MRGVAGGAEAGKWYALTRTRAGLVVGGLKGNVILRITGAYRGRRRGGDGMVWGREKARRVVASGFGGAARDGAAGLWLAGV